MTPELSAFTRTLRRIGATPSLRVKLRRTPFVADTVDVAAISGAGSDKEAVKTIALPLRIRRNAF
ncbi:hypothetical protein QCM80_39785 [Bradyrhizobium sp. SSUT112]|uniref:hypothetical protein n=1 Tax=Bradyrhizobium sp. SSUT112 TaxID=3040604 RepID=UPI0024484ED9|nr:hypothetical protein [Bradyrhizobium sp. SSUT112]MDH2356716.1 hypothetical protein [Bradyrhizobium sp. SSUT112]